MDNTEWRVSPDNNIDEELDKVLSIKSALESINDNDIDTDRQKKNSISHMILAVFVYISFVSSIWIALLGITNWYGVLIFGILSIFVSDIHKYGG